MTPEILFSVFWATFLGIIVGMLPGLTATMGIALLTGLTYQWESSNAIVILIAMYVGAIYGGSRSAILVNIPGTPANAATCIDGHPLAMQGKAGEAIGIATTSSFLGSHASFASRYLLRRPTGSPFQCSDTSSSSR